jgi:hypothetical protein
MAFDNKERFKERYRNDEEFRERVKASVRESEKKRYKSGKTWKQNNPDSVYVYLKGYRAGMKKAREHACADCKKAITKAMWEGNPKPEGGV